MSRSLQARPDWPIAWTNMYQQVVQNRIEAEQLLAKIRKLADTAKASRVKTKPLVIPSPVVVPPLGIAIETKKKPGGPQPLSLSMSSLNPETKVYQVKDIRPVGVAYSFDCAFAEENNLHFRQSMQDAEFIDTRGETYASFGVCDGHGDVKYNALVPVDSGKVVAEYAAQQIPIKLAKYIEAPYSSPKEVFTNVFADVDIGLEKDSKFKGGGACVTMATVYENTLYTANAGDCRIVLAKRTPVPFGVWSAVRLTKDHKPDDPDETARIKKLGGAVYSGRLLGKLGVSRALGDHEFRPYISRVPDVTETKLARNMYALIIACDGLWDVVDDSEAVQVLSKNSDKDAKQQAQLLVNLAVSKGSTDNITVMIVRFYPTDEAEGEEEEQEEVTKEQESETEEIEQETEGEENGKDEAALKDTKEETDEGTKEEFVEDKEDEEKEAKEKDKESETDLSKPEPLAEDANDTVIKTYLEQWIRYMSNEFDWDLDEDEDDKLEITFKEDGVIRISIPANNVSGHWVDTLLQQDLPQPIHDRIETIKMSRLTSFEEADLEESEQRAKLAKEKETQDAETSEAEEKSENGQQSDVESENGQDAEAEGDVGEEKEAASEEDEKDDDDEGDEGEGEEVNVRQTEQKEALKKLALYVDVHKITDYHPENTTFVYDDDSILITLDTTQVPGQELEEFFDNQGVFSDEDVHVTVKTQYSLEDNVRRIIAEYAREHKLDKYKDSETTIKVIESTDAKDETDTLDIRINLDAIPYDLSRALSSKFNKYRVEVQKTGLNDNDIDAVLTRLRLGVREARIVGPIDETTKTVNIILNKPTLEISKVVDALKEYAPEYTYNVVRGRGSSSGKGKGKQGKKSNTKGGGGKSKDENVLEMEEDD